MWDEFWLVPVSIQISNEVVKAMVMPNEKAVNELKEEFRYLERSLVQEGKTDAEIGRAHV